MMIVVSRSAVAGNELQNHAGCGPGSLSVVGVRRTPSARRLLNRRWWSAQPESGDRHKPLDGRIFCGSPSSADGTAKGRFRITWRACRSARNGLITTIDNNEIGGSAPPGDVPPDASNDEDHRHRRQSGDNRRAQQQPDQKAAQLRPSLCRMDTDHMRHTRDTAVTGVMRRKVR